MEPLQFLVLIIELEWAAFRKAERTRFKGGGILAPKKNCKVYLISLSMSLLTEGLL